MSAPQPVPERPGGWVVGHVAGAPIVLAPSSLLGAVLLTAVYAPSLSAQGPRGYVVAAALVVLLFASVLVHELAHGLVARRRGQQPRAFVLTLWGGHTTFDGPEPTPGTTAMVAIVGPLANLLLALGFFGLSVWWDPGLLTVLGQSYGPFRVLSFSPLGERLLFSGALSNAFVGLFNLLPGLPLDGGRILQAAVWAATGDRVKGVVGAGWTGRGVAVGTVLIVLGRPLVAGGSLDLMTVAWAALIGAFLFSGASSAVKAGRQTRAVDALTVSAVGRPAVGVAFDVSVLDAGLAAQRAGTQAVVVLAPDGRPAAYVDASAAAAVPPDQVAVTGVQAVAVPLPYGAVVDASLTGAALLRAVSQAAGGSPVVVATDAGRVVALLHTADLLAALRS